MKCKTCAQVGVQKCKAECCRWVPIKKQFILDHWKDLQREIFTFIDAQEFYNGLPSMKGYVYPITYYHEIIVDGQKVLDINKDFQWCPFLTENKRCAVYKERPQICKSYGTCYIEGIPLTCGYCIGKNYSYPPKGHPDLKKWEDPSILEKNFDYMMKNHPDFMMELISDFKQSIK